MNRDLIRLGVSLELARRDFVWFCRLMAPDFYKPERRYLTEFCRELQSFYESDQEVLVVNIPPRHGKSRTAGLFVQWVLGQNQQEKIMTGSYNETLSTVFSKNVRDSISEIKADWHKIVYQDIFPGVAIKQGDGAMNLWSLNGGYNNYLATSPTGTATGFGCTLLIIDDLIKNAMEAYNEGTLEKHWEWFTNTMLSRLEEGGKIIVIMTRWATKDLAGRILAHYQKQNAKIRHISLQAVQPDGSMLCPDILSKDSYQRKVAAMGKEIASANFQQQPVDIEGRLYQYLKTYESVPTDAQGKPLFQRIRGYIDTADTGCDFLCLLIYGEYQQEAYLLDVLYTKAGMEITEPTAARMLIDSGCNQVAVESNNGGRSFARNIERIMRQELGSNKCVVRWFHQSANKQARIFSNSSWVMEHIYFPVNWQDRWPEFYRDVTGYQKEGKNLHDDAPDALTGIAEQLSSRKVWVR